MMGALESAMQQQPGVEGTRITSYESRVTDRIEGIGTCKGVAQYCCTHLTGLLLCNSES